MSPEPVNCRDGEKIPLNEHAVHPRFRHDASVGAGTRPAALRRMRGPEPAPPASAARDLDLLSSCALFHGLSGDAVRRLRQSASPRVLARGECCFLQEDRADAIYVLTAGTLKLVRTGGDGRQVILHVIEPGDAFGYVDVFDRGVHRGSAEAVQDSRLLFWGLETLTPFTRAHPTIMRNACHLLATRASQNWGRLHDLAASRAEQRIARALLGLTHRAAEWDERAPTDVVGLIHQDLADLAGTNMYTVSRILSRWKRSRVVDTRRGEVIIQSSARLEAIAGALA